MSPGGDRRPPEYRDGRRQRDLGSLLRGRISTASPASLADCICSTVSFCSCLGLRRRPWVETRLALRVYLAFHLFRPTDRGEQRANMLASSRHGPAPGSREIGDVERERPEGTPPQSCASQPGSSPRLLRAGLPGLPSDLQSASEPPPDADPRPSVEAVAKVALRGRPDLI
jgi:hypothetical protein